MYTAERIEELVENRSLIKVTDLQPDILTAKSE